MFLQGAPSLLSYNGLPTPPCQPSHPRAGLGFKWQTGLPSRQDPSLPNKGQNLEGEGQEVEDNMFLGIRPLTTLKLTQSPIQNLTISLQATCGFPIHICTAVNAGKKTPTQFQI